MLNGKKVDDNFFRDGQLVVKGDIKLLQDDIENDAHGCVFHLKK